MVATTLVYEWGCDRLLLYRAEKLPIPREGPPCMSDHIRTGSRFDVPVVDVSDSARHRGASRAGDTTIDDNVVLLLPTRHASGVEQPLVVRLHEALDAANETILVIEPTGRVLFANKAARRTLGLGHDTDVAHVVEELLVNAQRADMWHALELDQEWRGELKATRSDGATVHLDVTLLPDRAAGNDIRSLTVVAHDIGEQRALEQALEHQATHDGLTGLHNRQSLLRQLDEALIELHDQQQPAALMLIDIDEFRTVTNSLGHDAGDRILVAFAYRMLRTFPTTAVLARVGGDEFAVFCPGTDDLDMLSDDVSKTTAAPFYIDGSEVHLSTVTGVAMVHAQGPARTGEELLREADAAAYRGKERGRGSYEIFEPKLQAAVEDRLAIVQDLRRALRNDELRLYYQPKVDLTTGAITGAEALLRWQTPDGEMRPPASFLDVAEDTGLIIPIGRWVLEQACQTLLRIQRAVGGDEPFELSVNLSVRQLSHPALVDELAQVVEESGVDPHQIELEVTESAIMDDVQASTELLDRLKRLGTRIAVDDFGTGYSSLQYLQKLPVDVLKIDRSFVAGIGGQTGDQAIVTAVIELAHALHLRSVAEGVETAEQLAELRALGCEHAQGYFISRPIPEAELIDLVIAQPRW